MRDELVSIIIPTKDRPSLLREAVKSALRQTHRPIELIIIDDGSKEEGRENRKIISQLTGRPPREGGAAQTPSGITIKYVYQQNSGIGVAVNRGLQLAEGSFIQRLDDDDLLLPRKVERCLQIFRENPDVGLVATGYYVIDKEGNRLREARPNWSGRSYQLLKMMLACISAQVSVMVRRECYDVVGPYRTDIMGEDYEMWIRIARRFAVETIDEPLACYRRHDGNITKLKHKQLELDVVRFISSYLQEIPMEELIPGVKEHGYGYLMRAAILLSKGGIFVSTVDLAEREVRRAKELLGKGDPLVHLWEIVLALHRGEPFDRPSPPMSPGLREIEGRLKRLLSLRKEFEEKKLHPSSPEMRSLRREYGRVRAELIGLTLRRALGHEV